MQAACGHRDSGQRETKPDSSPHGPGTNQERGRGCPMRHRHCDACRHDDSHHRARYDGDGHHRALRHCLAGFRDTQPAEASSAASPVTTSRRLDHANP
ncbi:hypothetical protein FBY22_3919 [Streptomyces sp. SLBN-31]|nr:hypothetical protein FBY22_3919 [Streptomyces sp. SLBN-31]